MKRQTYIVPNSPQPHTLPSAAGEIGCSPSTLRTYVRRNLVTPQRTPAGTMIFYPQHIDAARRIFERRNNKITG